MNRVFNKYDVLKGIAILLVVIGHITILFNHSNYPTLDVTIFEKVTALIYLFHMPLFIATSGAVYQICFAEGKYNKFTSFASNKIKRILLPYLFVGLFVLLPTLVVIGNNLSFTQPSLYGKIILAKDPRHLWFLLALSWIFLIQFSLDKLRVHRWIQFCIAIVLSMGVALHYPGHFFAFSEAIHYWPFFLVGVITENLFETKMLKNDIEIVVVSLIFVSICGVGIYVNKIIWIDIFLNYMMQCGISILLIAATGIWVKLVQLPKWLITIIDYSFGIYLFHVSVIFLMHHFLRDWNPGLLLPVMFVAGVILPIGITWVIRKINLHFLIGEKRR